MKIVLESCNVKEKVKSWVLIQAFTKFHIGPVHFALSCRKTNRPTDESENVTS